MCRTLSSRDRRAIVHQISGNSPPPQQRASRGVLEDGARGIPGASLLNIVVIDCFSRISYVGMVKAASLEKVLGLPDANVGFFTVRRNGGSISTRLPHRTASKNKGRRKTCQGMAPRVTVSSRRCVPLSGLISAT